MYRCSSVRGGGAWLRLIEGSSSSLSAVDRRKFLIAVGGLLVAPAHEAKAQPSKRVYRVGYLTTGKPKPTRPNDVKSAFVQGMRERGYVEGKNLVIEWRGAEGHGERLPQLAKDLVASKVDVIVSSSDATHPVIQRATTTIPVVMLISQDPVGRGLVASLAHPGGNFTGLSSVLVDLTGKQLELLREAIPKASKLAYLWDNTNELPANVVKATLDRQAAAARALDFTLYPYAVRNLADLEPTFAAIAQERVDALRIAFSPFTYRNRAQILKLALRARMPTLVGSREFTVDGGLISYGVDMHAIWRRGAYYVDRILKGDQPGDLPIEQPTKFDLVVNLKTAKAVGVALPPSILLRADRVIE